MMKKKHKLTNWDNKLALGLAAFMFSIGLFYLYNDKFNPMNFCVMNGNDPFCEKFNRTNCFNQKTKSIFAENFEFGGFIEIESGFGF